ncbi:MAG: PAS domain-containing protein [Candidatus Marinimicrobia bacterium]|nr:PAS domain-containing protein [Candidatus Neomarinimicrobiota bacterium]MBT3632698.1 PAS domain-containing protein [Candidatus Neomarinimicrobiota bacterium]MBT3823540.1 PAS domain-containing protein [Candidatus Neomarinimicrobiota bacterium]MBT4129616.1 PAS domain-containing protein [Candidatus Neomarinimicrobiota bacterium]MBT4294567.1 PAS domain-containing protein [Candidatus Neomarinimicrobiota bacterium]
MKNKYSRDEKNRVMIALFAVVLGLSASIGSLLLGVSVLEVTSYKIENQIAKFYQAKATSLASISSVNHSFSDSTLLAEMNRSWQTSPDLPKDEYICVIDDSSLLLYHSGQPHTVGNNISENQLVDSEQHMTSTLGTLVQSPKDYVGHYVSSAGELQIAAFSPIPGKNWMIGVHRSKSVVDYEIDDSLRPQYWGILIISLGIIPLALLLLYYSMHRGSKHTRVIVKELARERILLQGLIDNTPDHIYFKDRDSRFIKINNSQAKFLNLRHPEEAIGKTEFDFFPKEHAQVAFEDEQRMLKTGKPLIGSEEHHVIDNKDQWISSTKWPLQDTSGEVFGTVGISRDITEISKTRIEFEQQTKFLEDVISSLQHPFLVIDANDYSILLANPTARNSKFGSASSCYALSHGFDMPCDSEEHPCPLVITKDTKQPAVVEHIHLGPNGHPTPYEVHSFPIFDEDGEVAQVIEYSLDISERKSVEKKLRREYQLQAVLYQIASAEQFSKTLEDLCQSIHSFLSEVLDTKNFYIAILDSELKKLSFPLFIDEYDDHPGTVDFGRGMTEYMLNSKKSLLAHNDDMVRMDENGEIALEGTPAKIWLGTPMRIGDHCVGAIVVQSYDDENHFDEGHVNLLEFVSSQIATSVIAKQAEDKLAVSERLKELLLDILTHDLRNPIGSIYNFSELARDQFPDDTLIEHIHIGSTRLLKVLDNTTLLSQTVFGETIPLEILNLYDMLYETIDEFSTQIKETEMTLELNCSTDIQIKANPILGEIFKNYISNAIKYASVGKRIIVQAWEEDGVQISVDDFGDTIPEQERSLVFERNIQLAKEKKVGRGLGLAIVKRIAQAHNAQVWVEPNTPRGNRFYLHMPQEIS